VIVRPETTHDRPTAPCAREKCPQRDASGIVVDSKQVGHARAWCDPCDAGEPRQVAYESANVVSDARSGKMQEDVHVALFHLNLLEGGIVVRPAFAFPLEHGGRTRRQQNGDRSCEARIERLCRVCEPSGQDGADRLANREASYYLAFDVLQLAALLYLTGGITNPFALMFVAPVVIGDGGRGQPYRRTRILQSFGRPVPVGLRVRRTLAFRASGIGLRNGFLKLGFEL